MDGWMDGAYPVSREWETGIGPDCSASLLIVLVLDPRLSHHFRLLFHYPVLLSPNCRASRWIARSVSSSSSTFELARIVREDNWRDQREEEDARRARGASPRNSTAELEKRPYAFLANPTTEIIILADILANVRMQFYLLLSWETR